MKKGFTLIELLAVIIILAVIALIATPIVLDVIEDSKKSAAMSATAMVKESAELYYAEEFMKNNGGFSEYECTFTKDGGCSEIQMNGERPDNGTITINKDGVVNGKIEFNGYTYFICNSNVVEEESSNCSVTDYTLIYDITADGIITGFKTNTTTAYLDIIPVVNADTLTSEALSYLESKKLTIPEYIGEIKVTGIAANAFGNYDIETITILTIDKLNIGENAFPTTAKLRVKSCVAELYSGYENEIELVPSDCASLVKPICTLSNIEDVYVGKTVTAELVCTNEKYGIKDQDISTSSIVADNTLANITAITRTAVENGYKYTITIKGVSEGKATITIPEKVIYSGNDISGDAITSNEFEVFKKIICKRADVDTLHTEVCAQTSSYCAGSEYKNGDIITYGNIETTDELVSGDAFDCDVDGDGDYGECDTTTGKCSERFYYVSRLYDTAEQTWDNNYAVLIYYNNTANGIADNTSDNEIAYYEVDESWHGPVAARTNLPTTYQWSSIRLSNIERAIILENGSTYNNGGIFPTKFSYEGYAARLLTIQELKFACDITSSSILVGELDACNYLLENTKYSSSSIGSEGYWLETPHLQKGQARLINCSNRYRSGGYVNYSDTVGVRPVIEVPIENLEY